MENNLKSNTKSISIIGFGRFGKVLYRLLKDDFHIVIFTRNGKPHYSPCHSCFRGNQANLIFTKSLAEVYKSDVIFYAVPISEFEKVIKQHKKYFKPEHLLVDVLSVKVHPKQVFEKYLRSLKTQALLTHPMFGPDSSREGFAGLPIIIDKFKSGTESYTFWKNYFKDKQLRVVEMTPEEHDKLAANSQGLTHFIGRLLEKINYQPTSIDSLGSKKLLEIKDQTCNDTWQLFKDLQTYNPYTKSMRLHLGKAYNELYNQLLPERVNPGYSVFGIQGGKASFNEQALEYYHSIILERPKGTIESLMPIDQHNTQKNNNNITIQQYGINNSRLTSSPVNNKILNKIRNYKVKYLYTTEKVLHNLHEGNIDYGLFAITNSTGGLVDESIQALTKYPCNIVSDFEFLIRHYLMKRKDVEIKDVSTIIAHPQVLKQCEKTLKSNYSQYKLISGTGDAVDTAKAAELLASGVLPGNTAILGPVGLAKLYDLEIIAEDLQDKKDNLTRFLLVKR